MKITKHNSRQSGFTIIELTLAMTMLSVLLIIILLSVFNLISIYNKGITLKRANQSARTIASEMQADFRRSVAGTDGGVSVGERTNTPTGHTGAILTGICTGQHTYLWNTINNDGSSTNETYDNGDPVVGMIQLSDSSGEYCKNTNLHPPKQSTATTQVKLLLEDGLIIHELTKLDIGGSGKLMKFTFTVSTDDTGVITAGQCSAGADGEFCALNTFIVTSYARGI